MEDNDLIRKPCKHFKLQPVIITLSSMQPSKDRDNH